MGFLKRAGTSPVTKADASLPPHDGFYLYSLRSAIPLVVEGVFGSDAPPSDILTSSA